jgi:hypothetical protein
MLWLSAWAVALALFLYRFWNPPHWALLLQMRLLQCKYAFHKLLEYFLRLYIVLLEARYVLSRFGVRRTLRRFARRHDLPMLLNKLRRVVLRHGA